MTRRATAEERKKVNESLLSLFLETNKAGLCSIAVDIGNAAAFYEKGRLFGEIQFEDFYDMHVLGAGESIDPDFDGVYYCPELEEVRWVQDGELHNELGPAVIGLKHKSFAWFQNGIEHNVFGPAVLLPKEATRRYSVLGESHAASKFLDDTTRFTWMHRVLEKNLADIADSEFGGLINHAIAEFETLAIETIVHRERQQLLEKVREALAKIKDGQEFTQAVLDQNTVEPKTQSKKPVTESIPVKEVLKETAPVGTMKSNSETASAESTLMERATATMKSDGKKAAFRIAANQTTKLIQESVVAFLTKDLKGKQKSSMKTTIVHALQSEEGDMAVSMMIGVAMPFVAEKLPDNAKSVAIAMGEEFRVRAMAGLGTKIVDAGFMVVYEQLASNFAKIIEPVLELDEPAAKVRADVTEPAKATHTPEEIVRERREQKKHSVS